MNTQTHQTPLSEACLLNKIVNVLIISVCSSETYVFLNTKMVWYEIYLKQNFEHV